MLRILHLTSDDKFFDGPIKRFQSDPELDHKAYLTSFGVKQLKYIKSKDEITILNSKQELQRILEKGDYDVVFFYSLPFDRWWMVEAIPKDKIVIWWEWGFELYGRRGGLTPLIDIPLYKPLTSKYVSCRLRTVVIKVLNLIRFGYKWKKLLAQRKRVLERIDYLMPVIPEDYELLRNSYPEFHAKLFHYPLADYKFNYINVQRPKDGGILLGNSSLVTNNHLDIWNSLMQTGVKDRKIIVPLNYGEFDTASYVSKRIESKDNEVMILRTFMPQTDYFNLIDGCSYAVFGVIRQQAMGNINRCIRDGIKIFLYKDSVVYKSLIKSGFRVFAIEDMDLETLSTPLTEEDNKHNHQIFAAQVMEKINIYNSAKAEIKSRLKKN